MLQAQLGQLVDPGDGDVGVVELRHDLQHPAELAQHGAQGVQLGKLGEAAGHGPCVLVHVDKAGRQADGPGLQALAQHALHGGDLVGPRRALVGLRAHHPDPDDAVPHQGGDIDGQPLFQGAPIAFPVLPGPVEGECEGLGR